MMDGQLQKEEKDALLDYRLKNLIGEEEHWQVGGWMDGWMAPLAPLPCTTHSHNIHPLTSHMAFFFFLPLLPSCTCPLSYGHTISYTLCHMYSQS